MLYVGVAHALDTEYQLFDFSSWAELSASLGEDAIKTSSHLIRIPRILVLQAYDRMPIGRIRFSRRNIFVRDNDCCQYCGDKFHRKDLSLDHVLPRSQGGMTTWENIVAACIPCNSRKGGRTPAQAGIKLLRPAKKPTWTELRTLIGPYLRFREWLPFMNPVDAAYWNTELDSD